MLMYITTKFENMHISHWHTFSFAIFVVHRDKKDAICKMLKKILMGYKIEDIIIEVKFIFGSFLPVVKNGHFMLLAKWTWGEFRKIFFYFNFLWSLSSTLHLLNLSTTQYACHQNQILEWRNFLKSYSFLLSFSFKSENCFILC